MKANHKNSQPLERHIKKGQRFSASSKGKPAIWEVSRSVKTEDVQKIWCKVVRGINQEIAYTRKQFGYLIRSGIIRLSQGGIK